MKLSRKVAAAVGAVGVSLAMTITAGPAHADGYSNVNVYVGFAGQGLCLDVDGSRGYMYSGANVQLWNCDGGDVYQKWTLESDSTIRPSNNENLCLDASGSHPGVGSNVQVWTCNGAGYNQAWKFNFTSNLSINSYVNPAYLCLDADGSSALHAGTNVQLWTCNGGSNQMWTFGLPS